MSEPTVQPELKPGNLRWRVLFTLFAVGLAAYTGIRLPNLWATTLYSVSVTDGFIRRSLVGTVLEPIYQVFGHTYEVAAIVAFVVLIGLVSVVAYQAIRARLASQRLVVLAWLLLPTGGYLFHEVGYLDQVIYLILFLCLWLLGRRKWVIATVLMVATSFTHEMALFTVIPVFILVAFYSLPRRAAVIASSVPMGAVLLLLLVPPTSTAKVSSLASSFTSEGFPFRQDALDLFSRTQAESWSLYSYQDVVFYLVPIAIVVITILAVLRATGFLDDVHLVLPAKLPVFVAVSAVSISPAFLALGGWDGARWGFLLVSNFFIVLFLVLSWRQVEFTRQQLMVLALALLVISRIQFPYFDSAAPRAMQLNEAKALAKDVVKGTFFTIPSK